MAELGKTGRKIFILYDGRAKSGNTDDASVMDVADSVNEAWQSTRQCWRDIDAIWYENEFELDGKTAVEVGPRWDIGKGILL